MTIITFEVIIPLALFLLAGWVIATQMIIPVLAGARLFPALRRNHLELVDELHQVEADIEAESLRHRIETKKAELAKERQRE